MTNKISEELISATIPMVKVESPKVIVRNYGEEQKEGDVTERSTGEERVSLVLKNKLAEQKN